MNTSPFLKKVRDTLRTRQMSLATEKIYCYWIRCFIRFHAYKSPSEIQAEHVTQFLTHLAVNRNVSPNTQNQAFSALVFLFRHVLGLPLENVDATRAKQSRRIPVVLTTSEVVRILSGVEAPFTTMIQLAWGAGMRKMEILRLRIKDIDFDRRCITIREGKGRKGRITVLPDCTVPDLQLSIRRAENYFRLDADEGFHSVAATSFWLH